MGCGWSTKPHLPNTLPPLSGARTMYGVWMRRDGEGKNRPFSAHPRQTRAQATLSKVSECPCYWNVVAVRSSNAPNGSSSTTLVWGTHCDLHSYWVCIHLKLKLVWKIVMQHQTRKYTAEWQPTIYQLHMVEIVNCHLYFTTSH